MPANDHPMPDLQRVPLGRLAKHPSTQTARALARVQRPTGSARFNSSI